VIRYTLSLLAGMMIALALFWFMQYLISNHQQGLKKTDSLHMTEFVRLKQETKIQTKKRTIADKPKPPKRPKPPKMPVVKARISKAIAPNIDMPQLDIPLQNTTFSGSVLAGVAVDGNAVGTGVNTHVIPLLRIPPVYPMRAANRHIQGWVKIEFTITKEGRVKEPVVVAAEPSSIFNRAALKAIRRWKFKPKIIAGEAYEQRAVQTLEFKLRR